MKKRKHDPFDAVLNEEKQETNKAIMLSNFKCRRRLGTAKGLINIRSDFNAPMEDFKDFFE